MSLSMAHSSLNTTAISFEFFPPKSSEGDNKLVAAARALKGYHPAFVSVTFGALGSTSTRTPDSVALLQKEGLVDVAPHLTVVGLDKEAIANLLDAYKAQGVKRIVALRGDKQEGSVMAFPYASHLVAFIRQRYGNHFHIEVAAYPEVHPEATSARDDLFHLKEKIEAGAQGAITQYFYNLDAYCYFVEACQRIGITAPIVPGIMPIYGREQLLRFSARCGAEVPRWLDKRLADLAVQDAQSFGIEVLTRLCQRLCQHGAPALHFYTLNESKLVAAILDNLGFQARAS